MHLFSTKTSNKHIIINLLFSSLVISFIAGNLVLNLNIVLFIVFSLFFFKKEICNINFDFFDKILIFLFTYVLFCTLLNNIFYFKNGSVENFLIFIKSVLFLRFLLFYFIVKYVFVKSRIFRIAISSY